MNDLALAHLVLFNHKQISPNSQRHLELQNISSPSFIHMILHQVCWWLFYGNNVMKKVQKWCTNYTQYAN